ncbi:MAG: hypothetical protein H0Z37_06995 [Firmicutes bacterium]|nr:hypothetical protein [Bacillota bacterium]
MDLEPGSTRMFRCALCGTDAPHRLRARRGTRCAILCTNCGSGSIVGEDDLLLYQVRWEEELRQILEQLAENDDKSDDHRP